MSEQKFRLYERLQKWWDEPLEWVFEPAESCPLCGVAVLDKAAHTTWHLESE